MSDEINKEKITSVATPAWYSLTSEDTAKILEVSGEKGLSVSEIPSRIEKFGKNILEEEKGKARSSPIAGRAVSSPSASLIARRAADIL